MRGMVLFLGSKRRVRSAGIEKQNPNRPPKKKGGRYEIDTKNDGDIRIFQNSMIAAADQFQNKGSPRKTRPLQNQKPHPKKRGESDLLCQSSAPGVAVLRPYKSSWNRGAGQNPQR